MVQDHLGNTFETKKKMCEYHGISYNIFNYRRKNGWNLKDILETPMKTCQDHLGNKFNSYKEMYEYWGLNKNTFHTRKNLGWSIEKILTTPIERVLIDHKGIRWECQSDALEYYGVSYNTFWRRRKLGWSLQESLETPIGERFSVTDHLGNQFINTEDMCNHWKINSNTFRYRLKRGWNLKDALEAIVEKNKTNNDNIIIDHLGNEYTSKSEMCKYWNIKPGTFNTRVRLGWNLQKALETDERKINNVQDHEGNIFKSKADRAKYYNKDAWIVKGRLNNGWDLKKALETPVKKEETNIEDGMGSTFKNRYELCNYYGFTPQSFDANIKRGKKLKEIILYTNEKIRTDDKGNKYWGLGTIELVGEEPLSNTSNKVKECNMTNRELFEASHSVSLNEQGKKIYTCRLCGKQAKRVNELNLEENIARTNPGLYWCSNTSCIGRLSSIAYDENPDMCVPKIIYKYNKKQSGTAVYKFECLECGLVAPMTFEQIVEHKLKHFNSKG